VSRKSAENRRSISNLSKEMGIEDLEKLDKIDSKKDKK